MLILITASLVMRASKDTALGTGRSVHKVDTSSTQDQYLLSKLYTPDQCGQLFAIRYQVVIIHCEAIYPVVGMFSE